jgi:hypothetical protein
MHLTQVTHPTPSWLPRTENCALKTENRSPLFALDVQRGFCDSPPRTPVAARVPRTPSPQLETGVTAMNRRQLIWSLAALVAPSLLAGCQTFTRDADKGYKDEDATWGKAYRPPSKKKEKFFFDEKAQQIEESLGM